MNSSLVKKGGKLAKIISAGDLQWVKAAFSGVAAGIEHRHILSNLDPLRAVVDIGANHGQFALVVRHYFPDANIFSFEPLSGPASKFRKVFKDDSRVIFHQVAIGPMTGETIIHVSAMDDSSSLLPISQIQQRLFHGTWEVRTETIKVGRLTDFVAAECIVAPAMLKLDVQGFELEALQGCEELLKFFVYIYVECSFVELYIGQALAHDVIEWLEEYGFILTGVYNILYSKRGEAIQGDFLFTKKITQ